MYITLLLGYLFGSKKTWRSAYTPADLEIAEFYLAS
jgi:hypothetical protein